MKRIISTTVDNNRCKLKSERERERERKREKRTNVFNKITASKINKLSILICKLYLISTVNKK
jgi:hypothetical protein